MRALIADDEMTSRVLLRGLLASWGYEVEVVCDGAEALERLRRGDGPRLAILDWIMPGTTGLDVCRQIKARTHAPYVYTMLITHRTDPRDVAIALEAGADDYIRKPIDHAELKARVGVGHRLVDYDARLREKAAQIERYAAQMEALADERAQQLVQADKMATLGVLAAGVAHEINNPTTFISGNAQTILKFWEDLRGPLEAQRESAPKASKLAFIVEEMPKALRGIQTGVRRISKIVDGLKAYSRQDNPKRSQFHVNALVERAVELCRFQAKHVPIEVNPTTQSRLPPVTGDPDRLEQVLVNLILNAIQAMDRLPEPRVFITTGHADTQVFVTVDDCGPGIPKNVLPRIWDPFFTTKPPGEGTGLGLAICRGIVEEHGGTLDAENRDSGGARFIMNLPETTRRPR